MTESQTMRVLNYMRTHGGITSMDAFRDFGITRLSARIFDLRKLGYDISNVNREAVNKYGEMSVFVEYRLTNR